MVEGYDPNANNVSTLEEASASLKGGRRSRRNTRKGRGGKDKKAAKKPAKKVPSKRTKKAPSKWILHVKAFARNNKCSYREALSNPKCKATYKKK